MSEPILEARSLFEEAAKKWVNKIWPDASQVTIVDQTWEPSSNEEKWPWHEVVEKKVPPERGKLFYRSGISWQIEPVEIELAPDFKPAVVYEQTYENRGDGDMEVTEDWSHTQSVQNEQSIELSRQASLGSEVSVTAGVNIKAVEIKGTATAKMSIDVGEKESTTHTETIEVSFGRSIVFTVPPRKTYKVQYRFYRGKEKPVPFTMKVKASGWIYFWTLYRPYPLVRDTHVYPVNIDGKEPVGIPQGKGNPMPDEDKSFEIEGTYCQTKYLDGHFILSDESSGADLTDQVQMVTDP